MKLRAALLLFALLSLLTVSTFAYSGGEDSAAPDSAAGPAGETVQAPDSPEEAPRFAPVRAYEGAFADVDAGSWYAGAAASAYEYGLLNGRSETAFAPQENITIAALLTIAARLRCIYQTGSDAPLAQAEASSPWYAPYVS